MPITSRRSDRVALRLGDQWVGLDGRSWISCWVTSGWSFCIFHVLTCNEQLRSTVNLTYILVSVNIYILYVNFLRSCVCCSVCKMQCKLESHRLGNHISKYCLWLGCIRLGLGWEKVPQAQLCALKDMRVFSVFEGVKLSTVLRCGIYICNAPTLHVERLRRFAYAVCACILRRAPYVCMCMLHIAAIAMFTKSACVCTCMRVTVRDACMYMIRGA